MSFFEWSTTFYDESSCCEIREQESPTEFNGQQETIKQVSKKKKSLNPTEAKNVPKNMGKLIKNFFINFHNKIIKQNTTIKKFVSRGQLKKNYTRQDLATLFQDDTARKLCSEYFVSFQIIQDILKSEKISDVTVHLKYVKKFFLATYTPEILQNLKYPQYQLQEIEENGL